MKKSTKKIIRGVTLAAIVGIFTIFDIGKGWLKDYKENVTTLKMILFGKQISNHDSRTFFICISDTSQNLEGLNITPIYENSEEYPIKSFDLKYVVQSSDDFEAANSPFFNLLKVSPKEYQYKYKDKSLSQISQTEEPFALSSLPKRDAYYIINSRASIAGVSEAYEFTVYVWIRIVPKKPGQSMSEWELVCQDVIRRTQPNSETFDRFYYCDGKFFNHFGMDLGPVVSENKVSIKMEQKDKDNQIHSPQYSEQPDIDILSYNIFKQDKKNYLRIITHQKTNPESIYRIICHFSNFGNPFNYAYKFNGNGNDTIFFNAYDADDIDNIVIPELDNDIKKDIYVSTDKSGRIILKSNRLKETYVECLVNDSIDYFSIVSKTKSNIINNAKSLDDVKVICTYRFEETRPWYNYLINLFFIIICIYLIYLSIDFFKSDFNMDLGEKLYYYFTLVFAIAVFIIFVIDLFVPLASYIRYMILSIFK